MYLSFDQKIHDSSERIETLVQDVIDRDSCIKNRLPDVAFCASCVSNLLTYYDMES